MADTTRLFGFLPRLCGMSAKFVGADKEAAIVWVWPRETKMLFVDTMAFLTFVLVKLLSCCYSYLHHYSLRTSFICTSL